MQTDALLKRLKTFEFLRGLDEPTLGSVAESSLWRVYAPNAVVFWEGDTETHLFYLQYGWLKVTKIAPDGRQQTLRFLGPGEKFNEIGVFAKRSNPVTAIALEESGIWLIPRPALEQALLTHPQTVFQVVENMAERLIGLMDLTADLSLRSVEARLVKFLLEQAREGVIERRKWTTQAELSAHLGTVPDVLSRILRRFTRSGWIEMDKRHIRILDRAGLAKQAALEEE